MVEKKDATFFARMTEFISDYWSELLTILLALTASAAEILSTNSVGVISGVGAVFSVIGISLITIKYRLQVIDNKIDTAATAADYYFSKHMNPEEVTAALKSAATINILAVSLAETLKSYAATLEERAAMGGKLRIVLMKPDETSLRLVSSRGDDEDVNLLLANYHFSIRKLVSIKKAARAGGSVSVRLVDFPTSYAILITEDRASVSRALIKIYSHKTSVESASLLFWILPWREKWWYLYFSNQFEQAWQCGEDLKLV